MTNPTPIISITYSPQEFELVQQWATQQNAQIAFPYNAGATFKDNVAAVINQESLMGADVAGFVIADSRDFGQDILEKLYLLLKANNFRLWSADQGSDPFTDSHFVGSPSQQTGAQAATHVTHIHNYGNSIINASGATARDIQQINNHIQTIANTYVEIAKGLEELTGAVSTSALPHDSKEEVLQRINDLSSEIEKPSPEQKKWAIRERLENLGKCLGAAGTVYEGYEKVKPALEGLVQIVRKTLGL